MGAFSTEVSVRWSDMDVYGHVNNARVVTLLEEARTELLFGEGVRQGAQTLTSGVIVVELSVRYRVPLVYSATPVRVALWVSELRGASFTLEYAVSASVDSTDNADGGDNRPAVTACTLLAPYNTEAKQPRRLTPVEREFLTAYRDRPGRNGAGDG
ncbi:MAG: acyl-CoA thioesterase [Pseudonocardiaceae bacterium]